MYEMVGEAIGVKPHLVHIPSAFIVKFMPDKYGSLFGDKAVSAIFDNSKIKKYVPEFQATITFQEGIKRTIDWFESNPERQCIHKDTDELMDKMIALYETAFNGRLQ
jgi:nucleoside-diphosphate-sugar epimerase